MAGGILKPQELLYCVRKPPLAKSYFCGKILENVNSHPYFGVEIDDRLRLKEHINHICNTANKMLGLVRRISWFCTESIKKALYVTLVRPKLEYVSVAWDPHFKCDIVRIEGVHRAAARFCTD